AFRINGLIEVPRAKFAWTLQGPRRARTYRSFRGETSYVLPGIVLARGTGDVVEGMLSGQGVFPLGVALDTVFVQNGRYAPLPRSSRVSLSAWHDSGDLAALRDSLPCAREAAPHTDTTGPTLALYANGQRLVDGASVPAKLLLDGVAHDQAGILIAPVPGATPRLYVNNPTYATDLSDLLLFDHNSTTTARFHLPLQLAGPLDSLYITMADNLLNLTTKVIAVRPLLSDVLRIESALVYPNPVRSDCVFTFQLTRQAEVRIRIYTLAGRLVRDLGASAAGFGYNQVAWDCRDRDGNSLANGVYLFILTAQSSDGPGREQRVSVRDKLLIRR
ncbi:hypothetical protein FJY70_01425, partial [candidate division WOR-3 bacterium]|nr:hypothetical protein [candidate division WOR-3 bacterium]